MSKIPGRLVAICATTAAAATVLVGAPATAAAPVEIKPSQLSRGADVQVPHVRGRSVVDGEVTVPVGGSFVDLLGRSGKGYVVVTRQNGRWSTQKVAEGRAPVVLARGTTPDEVVLAGDGKHLAVTRSQQARRTKIDVLRVRTGKRVATEVFADYPRVLDIQGKRAVVGGFDLGAVSWNLRTDVTSAITGKPAYAADISSNRLAFFTKDPYQGGCSVVTTLTAPRARLWRSCREAVREFSPNGARIVTQHKLTDGLGAGKLWERTVRGRLLASYTVGSHFGDVAWESRTDLLLDAYGTGKWAVVRCSDGDCERATKLRPTPDF